MTARTYLFVPGNRPERFAKALGTAADIVIIDLEDAVAAESKPAARKSIGELLESADRARVVVRINDASSPHFAPDLAFLSAVKPAAVVLAKTESAAQVASVREAVDVAVLALVESARGVDAVDEIARTPGVVRLMFGTIDYALDLALDLDLTLDPLAYGAARIVSASRLAGLPSPVAGVTPQINDAERLRSDMAWEWRHGFGAKLCIHPSQVAAVDAASTPSEDEVVWARRVIEADASSPGAARLDGKMIDRPVVLLAQRTLSRIGPGPSKDLTAGSKRSDA